jgi:hypothetical protein
VHIRTLGGVVTPQLMSSRLSNNSTLPTLTRPFITSNDTQHVQRTGTTPQPEDEYELCWSGNDPPHFVRVVTSTDAPLSRPDTLALPPAVHDNDKSAMPTVRTSGRAMGGNREVELHEAGADTLAARDTEPRPVSLARSHLSRCSHDEDWGAPPPPGAYYNDDDITSSYSLELEYLDDPTEPLTESQ